MICMYMICMYMICKFNINSGQKRFNGVPANSAADSVSQEGFPLGHQILKGAKPPSKNGIKPFWALSPLGFLRAVVPCSQLLACRFPAQVCPSFTTQEMLAILGMHIACAFSAATSGLPCASAATQCSKSSSKRSALLVTQI